MGTRRCDPPPAAREPQYTNLAHRPSSPPSASAHVSAPAAFHRGARSLTHDLHVSRPPAFSPPESLYPDRPSIQHRPHFTHPSAFTTCTSSRLFLSGGRAFFCSPTSLAPPVFAYLWRASLVHLRCRSGRWNRWRCYVLNFLFRRSVFSIMTHDISDLQSRYHPVSSNASSLFFVPIWCEICVLTWGRRHRVLRAASTN
jgi:hypothetical protein